MATVWVDLLDGRGVKLTKAALTVDQLKEQFGAVLAGPSPNLAMTGAGKNDALYVFPKSQIANVRYTET